MTSEKIKRLPSHSRHSNNTIPFGENVQKVCTTQPNSYRTARVLYNMLYCVI